MQDDNVIIEGIKRGDQNDFKRLFLKYYSPLVEYASLFVADEDAEDIVQSFMIYIWEHHEHLLITTSVQSFLFASVKNRSLNAIKHNEIERRVYDAAQKQLMERLELDDPDFYMAQDLDEQIRKAVDSLPETYRDTFKMSRYGLKKNEEIAAELGVSTKTVEYRISRSLRILRTALKDYLYYI